MADSSPYSLFDQSITAIQNAIPETDQTRFRPYKHVTNLVEEIRAICVSNQIQNERHRLVLCERKVTLFAHNFAPYFDIINKHAQVGQDWQGWFWGIVGFVFNVGSAHVLFLEKITNIFETMAHVLPRYRAFDEPTQRRSIDPTRRSSYVRKDSELVSLMSYVYADIIRFCIDLYCVFLRGRSGAGLRHRVKEPSSAHVLWRPLDSRYAQLEKRLRRHRKWFERELKETNLDLFAQNRTDYLTLLHTSPDIEVNGNEEVEAARMVRRLRRADRVKAWLSNCCMYQDLYEQKVRNRHPKSCTWFLETFPYCKWKNTPFDSRLANNIDNLQTSWQERIVFIQAKAGFGKTFLSGQVIDDLTTDAEHLNISEEPPTTAFFHFNAAHSYCSHPNDAFRSLAEQLVHAHRHDRSTLDALALLLRNSTEQEKASSDDVIALVALLLRQHPTFLVIDGIDECSDVHLFLTLLPELCRNSDTRVLLFSRPDIKIPLSYQKWASDAPHVVPLDGIQNAADIETFLAENLSKMADQGFFGISMDRSLLPLVTGRSNGVFLWASLLLKYLQSCNLSPDERRVALENLHQLEGVEVLYHNILSMIDRMPKREKRVAVDTFRWLSLSIRPLCITGTQVALAIIPGQPTTEDQYIANFEESIPHLTGGLVEVTNCSVVFMHRSVKEYLQSEACQNSPFSLYDERIVHNHLATKCISFLANDIPKRPLHKLQPYTRPLVVRATTGSGTSVRTESSSDSGYKSVSSGTSASTTTTASTSTSDTNVLAPDKSQTPPSCFDDDIPFLRYASLCWPIHLTRAIPNTTPHSPPFISIHAAASLPTQESIDPIHHTPWLLVLSAFLKDRSAVTAWVEASWRYSLPPNVSRLVPLIHELKSLLPPASLEGRELRWAIDGLRKLSEQLVVLKNEYGTTLRENQSLIWQTEGTFWSVWDERARALSEVGSNDL